MIQVIMYSIVGYIFGYLICFIVSRRELSEKNMIIKLFIDYISMHYNIDAHDLIDKVLDYASEE